MLIFSQPTLDQLCTTLPNVRKLSPRATQNNWFYHKVHCKLTKIISTTTKIQPFLTKLNKKHKKIGIISLVTFSLILFERGKMASIKRKLHLDVLTHFIGSFVHFIVKFVCNCGYDVCLLGYVYVLCLSYGIIMNFYWRLTYIKRRSETYWSWKRYSTWCYARAQLTPFCGKIQLMLMSLHFTA